MTADRRRVPVIQLRTWCISYVHCAVSKALQLRSVCCLIGSLLIYLLVVFSSDPKVCHITIYLLSACAHSETVHSYYLLSYTEYSLLWCTFDRFSECAKTLLA